MVLHFALLGFITSCVKVMTFRVVIISCVNGITSRGDYYILRQYYILRRKNRSLINNMQLQAANGTAIRTFGQRSVAVELGLAKSFEWSFTIADVSQPILGADVLRHYGLLVYLKCKRLVDAETF